VWTGITRLQWWTFAIVSSAWFFDTLDQRLFSVARIPAVSALMRLPPVDPGVQAFAKVATALFLLGWGVGGLSLGALGDRFGRVRVLTGSIAVYSIGSGLTALCDSPAQFAALRLLSGVGIGGVFGLAVAIITDTVEGSARIVMLAAFQLLSNVGNLMAAAANVLVNLLAAHDVVSPTNRWRWLFAVGALPVLLATWSHFTLEEPVSWLRLKSAGALPRHIFGPYVELFRDSRARRHLFAGTLLSVSGVAGIWAVGEYAVDLQQAVFTTFFMHVAPAEAVTDRVEQTKSAAFALQMLGGACGMAVFTWAAVRFGCRPAFIIGFSAAFVVTTVVYWRLQTPRDAFWMMPLMGAAQLSVFAGLAMYLPELFRTEVRATGVSFAYNVGRFAAAGGSLGSAYLATHVFAGSAAPAPLRYSAMMMCTVFLIGVLAAVRAPETRGGGEPPRASS